ncbi:MAG: PaaI family thioesterase [Acidimicrobiales bacterium]
MEQSGDEVLDLRRRAGDELRSVVDALLGTRTPVQALASAVDALAQVREVLTGPPDSPYPPSPGFWVDGRHSGWTTYLDASVFGGGANPLGMPMAIEWGTDDHGHRYAEGVVRLGRAYEGGPGMVHGGYVAGLIDHMFGAAMHTGEPAVTATLTVRFLAPTPVGRDLRLRAWFEPRRGRRLLGRATCHDGDTITAEAEGLFVHVDMRDMAERAQRGGLGAQVRRHQPPPVP